MNNISDLIKVISERPSIKVVYVLNSEYNNISKFENLEQISLFTDVTPEYIPEIDRFVQIKGDNFFIYEKAFFPETNLLIILLETLDEKIKRNKDGSVCLVKK